MFVAALVVLALAGCGRVRFQARDVGIDARADDAGIDAAVPVMPDAVMPDAVMPDVVMPDAVMPDAFTPPDASADAGFDAPSDMGIDAPADAGTDAFMSDAGMCAAILADEAAFTDEQVLACATHGGIGQCLIFDNSGFVPCPTCACEWYQQSTRVACGACPNRWTPTGCTDFGGVPPWAPECTASAPGRDLAICSLRALLRTGECAPCACP